MVLVRVSQLYNDRFKVEVMPCSYWYSYTEYEVERVVVDGTDIKVKEGETVYIEAITVRIAGREAEIRTKV